MQCYEYTMMLSYLHGVLAEEHPQLAFDATALGDILDGLGVDKFSALTRLDREVIQGFAFPPAQQFRKAA